jgi:hypothetical protein
MSMVREWMSLVDQMDNHHAPLLPKEEEGDLHHRRLPAVIVGLNLAMMQMSHHRIHH